MRQQQGIGAIAVRRADRYTVAAGDRLPDGFGHAGVLLGRMVLFWWLKTQIAGQP